MRELTVKFQAATGDLSKGFGDAARTTRQFRGTVEAEGAKTNRAWSLFTAGAKKIGGAIKAGAAASGVGIAAILGVSIAKGFSRLSTIDQATAKLTGLGKSAQEIQDIMAAATASVKGTAFGLGDAATVAAGAVAAGIKPGKDLQKTLDTIANAAAAAGVDLGDMGSIFNKVASNGKAGNAELQQLADRGVPVYAELAKQLGVSQEQVFKLASQGKISFADFRKAAEGASGGVAKAMGQTVTGAFSNVQAALGRFGAGLLSGVFPKLAPALNGLIPIIDKLTSAVGPLAESVGARLGSALHGVVDWLGRFVDRLDFSSVSAFTASLQIPSGIVSAWGALRDAWVKAQPALDKLKAAGGDLGASLGKGASSGIDVLVKALGFLADHIDTIVKALPFVVGAFVLWRTTMKAAAGSTELAKAATAAMTPVTLANTVASLANNVARVIAIRLEREHAIAMGERVGLLAASSLGTLRNTAALVASKVAMVAVSVATKAWAAGQWLLNAAMSANPLGLVVIAIAALVAGIVLAWKHSETFRAVVLAVWGAIKVAVAAVVDWFTSKVVPFFSKTLPAAVGVVVDWVKKHWPLILSILTGPIGAAVIFIIRHWDQIKAATAAAWNAVKSAIVNVWSSILTGIQSKVTAAVTTVKSLPVKIRAVFVGAASWLLDTGKNVVRGLISGISGMGQSLLSAAHDLVMKLPAVVRKALGIHSPSTVFRGIGQNIGAGLISGVDGVGSKVSTAAKRLAGKVRDAFGKGSGPKVGGGSVQVTPGPGGGAGGWPGMPPPPPLAPPRASTAGFSAEQLDQLVDAAAGKNLQVVVVLDKGQVRELVRNEAEVVVRETAGARR